MMILLVFSDDLFSLFCSIFFNLVGVVYVGNALAYIIDFIVKYSL